MATEESVRYVGLTRVSSERQGESGLGLSAGKHDLEQFVARFGGELLFVLEEVESGMCDDMMDRPTLLKALALCKKHKAHLLVPRVDRLARSMLVHADIQRSKVKVRFADDPYATEFVVNIRASMAAEEGRKISERTSKALQAYKRDGRISKRIEAMLVERHGGNIPEEARAEFAGKLGSDLVGSHFTDAGRRKAGLRTGSSNRAKAIVYYAQITPDVIRYRKEGVTFRAIADRLNEEGKMTQNGSQFTHVQVMQILKRAGI